MPPREKAAEPIILTPQQYREQLRKKLKIYTPTIKLFSDRTGGLIDAEVVKRLALLSIDNQPDLVQCSLYSVCRSVMMLAEIGLEPGGALQHAALVPYKNYGWDKAINPMVCKPTIMKEGYVTLAYRSGQVKKIDTYGVYKGDVFHFFGGDDARIVHERLNFEELFEDLQYTYSIGYLTNGERLRFVMPRSKILKLRAASPSAKFDWSPWAKWPIEMSLTKCVKHFCKNDCPKSIHLAKAISFDDAIEADDDSIAETEVPLLEEGSDPEGQTTRLLSKMGGSIEDAKGFDPLAASKTQEGAAE